jgi:hypothetical protein
MGRLPTLLVPSISVTVSFLQGFVSLALDRRPSHVGFPAFTTLIMLGSSHSWYIPWLLHWLFLKALKIFNSHY